MRFNIVIRHYVIQILTENHEIQEAAVHKEEQMNL